MTMNNIPLPDDFMAMLKNKEAILKSLLKDMDTCKKNQDAFEKMIVSLETGKADPIKIGLAFAKSNRHLNEMNARLCMLMLVYCSGSSFSGDVSNVLMKMGKGSEALQELFKQKLKGS